MAAESLAGLARARRWTELEKGFLAAIECNHVDAAELLFVIDTAVQAGQGPLAATLGWAWLATVKDRFSAERAMQLARDILVRLPDGDELRDDILTLYRQTHPDRADLEQWIERSGIKGGKSVRRALRFLDVGLQLAVGTFLIHRTDEEAAQITSFDVSLDQVTIRTTRGTRTFDIVSLIDAYEPVPENDFRVLRQLRSDRIVELATSDPTALVIGILRSHGNRIERDELKLMLVPRFLAAEAWSEWWSNLRSLVKKSPHLRIEGKSPMFLYYDPQGRTLEQDAWAGFEKGKSPRDWLETLESYLRDVKSHRGEPDSAFLDRYQTALIGNIRRFVKHGEPAAAFATALVIERLAADGLPNTTDAHGMALEMLSQAPDPVALVADIPDARLWPLAISAVEQAFGEKAAETLGRLILYCPAAYCDVLARKVEQAGRGDLLADVARSALDDPGRFTDACMWLWKGPEVRTPLPIPPPLELLTLILGLVGPARVSHGRTDGPSITEMRAKVRSGLATRDYARFCECIDSIDEAMAQAVRRLIERAEGLGAVVQENMLELLRSRFPKLWAKPKVAIWEEPNTLYFTPKGLDAKKAELDELVNVKMRENARAIGEAASHGDLSENSEYKFALEERDFLRARVAKLNRELSLGRVLHREDVPLDHVSIGQRVQLVPVAGGEGRWFTILGYDEADLARDVFSYQSPVAQALMGRRIGETATLKLDGVEQIYRIAAIECAL